MDDDESLSDTYRAMHERDKAKRADRREDAPELLTKAGIPFESRNSGAHLVVTAERRVIDFWPGTALWIVRGREDRNYGVHHLITFVKQVRDDR